MFSMSLRGAVHAWTTQPLGFELDPIDDNYLSLVDRVCELLAEDGGVFFDVSGFGEEQWNVDVATDLATILVQVPEMYAWSSDADAASVFHLDFYEQGVERRLTLVREGQQILIEGSALVPGPGDVWKPTVPVEVVAAETLRTQLRELAARFLALAAMVCPAAASHAWLLGHLECVLAEMPSESYPE